LAYQHAAPRGGGSVKKKDLRKGKGREGIMLKNYGGCSLGIVEKGDGGESETKWGKKVFWTWDKY